MPSLSDVCVQKHDEPAPHATTTPPRSGEPPPVAVPSMRATGRGSVTSIPPTAAPATFTAEAEARFGTYPPSPRYPPTWEETPFIAYTTVHVPGATPRIVNLPSSSVSVAGP